MMISQGEEKTPEPQLMKVRLKTMSIIYGFYNTLREHYASAEPTTRCAIRFALVTAFAGLLMASIESTLLTVLIGAALSWGMYLRLCAHGGAQIGGVYREARVAQQEFAAEGSRG